MSILWWDMIKKHKDLGKTLFVGVKVIHPEVESGKSVINVVYGGEQRSLDPVETLGILTAGISLAIKTFRGEGFKDYVLLSSVITQLENDFISTSNFEDAELYEKWKERRKIIT